VNSAQKQERIKAMLARYRDALAQGAIGVSGEAPDSRVLLFGKDFNDALRELDRCLGEMRKRGNQEAIQGVPLRTIRWHVIAYYLDVHYRQVPVYARVATKKGWTRRQTGFRLEEQRHREARLVKADLGIPWLAKEYKWDKIHLKAISEACGELMAA
jgi:hypothetical protein